MQIPNTITIPYSTSCLLQSHYIEPEQPQESYVMFTIFMVLICEETVILSPKFNGDLYFIKPTHKGYLDIVYITINSQNVWSETAVVCGLTDSDMNK